MACASAASFLLPLHERLDILRRDQPNIMPKPADLAAPVMRARAGLHRHQARRLTREKVEQPRARQLSLKHHRAVWRRRMQMKHILRNIDPDRDSICHLTPPQ
jgi:hypothetical protein